MRGVVWGSPAVVGVRRDDRPAGGARRPTVASRAALLALALVLLVVLAGCGGKDDPRKDVAAALEQLQTAVGTVPAKMDRRVVCAGLDERTRTALDRLGQAVTGVPDEADCTDVLGAARWRVRPLAAAGTPGTVDLERITVDGDTATVRPTGSGAPVRFRRADGEWFADLYADRRWRYRLERFRACTAAGRRFGRLRLPSAKPAAVERYLRAEVAILRRYERDVAARKAPSGLRAADAKLRRALAKARRRTQAAAAGVDGDPVAAGSALESTLRTGWDPAAQLPGAVSRAAYPITEGCANASALPSGLKRMKRSCDAVVRRVVEFEDIDTPAEYRRVSVRVAGSMRRLGRAIERESPSLIVDDVHTRTVRNVRRWASDLLDLADPVRDGDLPRFLSLARQLSLSGAVIDRGLAQLGVVCTIPERLPSASTITS